MWDQRQPAGRGELQDRAALPDQTVRCLDGITERAFYLRCAVLAVVGRDERFDRPVAAVGDRHLDHLGVRKDLAHPARDRGGRLGCGERSLERVGRDDNF